MVRSVHLLLVVDGENDQSKGDNVRKPSYSAVTSTLALVVALGGGAYAATLADNSVGTRHLKDDAVTDVKIAPGAVGTGDIAKDAVTGAKITSQTVQRGDIASNAINGSRVAAGSIAATDLSAGAKKVSGYQRKYSGNQTLPAVSVGNGFATANADCDPGKVAVGGGHWAEFTDIEIVWSYAIDDDTWQVQARNPSSATDKEFGAHVVCVNG